ncbi:MAG: DUF2155 domain-containing protein [Pseudooceanicola sp.]
MIRAGLIALAMIAGPASGLSAQTDSFPSDGVGENTRVVVGLGARLKALDKVNGQVSEFDILAGGAVQIGKLVVEMRECRYPEDNPSGEAFAFLVITETDDQIFSGWMIASSPALNALDHFRYDIWVLRCKTL